MVGERISLVAIYLFRRVCRACAVLKLEKSVCPAMHTQTHRQFSRIRNPFGKMIESQRWRFAVCGGDGLVVFGSEFAEITKLPPSYERETYGKKFAAQSPRYLTDFRRRIVPENITLVI